ncbi:DUF4173 domain-containing protein [Candidatus Parcubacteria bacterium]|nr:DUF4173 domain-containing protein [Candidatus Parcubacteria bacterium]
MKRVLLIFLFAFILGISVDYLFYGKPIGISFFVFVLISLIFSLILFKKFGPQITKVQYALLIPITLFSAMVFLRTSGFLTFFNIAVTLFLILLFFTLFPKKNLLGFSFQEYFFAPLVFFLKSFRKSARFIEEYIAKMQAKRNLGSSTFQSVVKGIIISIPILALFIWLFASADIVFQKYLDKLLIYPDIESVPEIILRILIVFLASYIFIGIFAKVFDKQKSETFQLKDNSSKKFLGNIESSVILSLVSLLFLIFIVIQFVYLFGGRDYVWGIEEYITYSEYARKGFGELMAVSIISFLLIYAIDRFAKRENFSQKNLFKILSGILGFEVFIIMGSALTRLSLYIDGYGYTLYRFLSFIFLFYVFSVFLFFLYKIFREKKEELFLFSVFCLTILFWMGVNFLSPDAFIAKRNIERYSQGKQLDYWYFNNLSADAIPEIVKVFNTHGEEKIKIEIAQKFGFRYGIYPRYLIYPWAREEYHEMSGIMKKVGEWQSFNLAEEKALIVLEENSQEIKKYLILYWDKEIERCQGDLEKCEREEKGGCNFIKDDCEKFQKRKIKLEEFDEA